MGEHPQAKLSQPVRPSQLRREILREPHHSPEILEGCCARRRRNVRLRPAQPLRCCRAVARVSHSSIALARCAGSGRGMSRRSGRDSGPGITRRRVWQRTGGDGKPAAQRLGRLRIGNQGRQILRPQGEKTARQIVFLAHRRQYRGYPRSWQHRLEPAHVFDEAAGTNRCIVALQHLVSGGTAGT